MGLPKIFLVGLLLTLARYEASAQKYGRVESGKWTKVTEITEEEESSSDDLEPLASKGGGFDHTFKYENSFGPSKYAFEYRRDGPNTYRERVEKRDGTNYHTKYDWGGDYGAPSNVWGRNHFPTSRFNFGHNHGDSQGKGGGHNGKKDYKDSLPWHDEDHKHHGDNRQNHGGHANSGHHGNGKDESHRRESHGHQRNNEDETYHGHQHNNEDGHHERIDRGQNYDNHNSPRDQNNHRDGSNRQLEHKHRSDDNKHHEDTSGDYKQHRGDNGYKDDNGQGRNNHHRGGSHSHAKGDRSNGNEQGKNNGRQSYAYNNKADRHHKDNKQAIKRRNDKQDGYGGENSIHG